MKTNQRIYFLLTLLFFSLFQNHSFAQEEKQVVEPFAINAIERAVQNYYQYQQRSKYMITTMKMIKISRTSGEFILSDIKNGFSYQDLQPTHYIRVNNELVLVKTDKDCNCNLEEFGFNKTSDKIKEEALGVLAGHAEAVEIVYNPLTNKTDTLLRKTAITGQPAPQMIFYYKKNKMNSLLYNYGFTPIQGKEYWRDWKLSLSQAQKSTRRVCVNKLSRNIDLKKTEKMMKDSLEKLLKIKTDLHMEIKNQDLSKLTFKCVFANTLQERAVVFSDTTSIYPYIEQDTTLHQPYQVLIFKKKKFWGQLSFEENNTLNFKPAIEFENDRFDKKSVGLYERILDEKPELIFYVDYFGTNPIWYTKSNKIFVLFDYHNYHIIEADEYIHRYHTNENIIRKMKM